MEYSIIRGPYLLLETVEMLYKFVNNISFRSLLSRRKLSTSADNNIEMLQRLDQLQEIMDETCDSLDPSDPLLRHYFACADTDDGMQVLCLARFLTYSFCTLKYHGFDESLNEIRALWDQLKKDGAWIKSCGIAGLSFSYGADKPGDLIDQIYRLDLPAGFRLDLYRALWDMDRTMAELGTLLRPIANRLEKTIHKADWILDMMENYWMSSPVTPLDFFSGALGEEKFKGAGDQVKIAISLMNCKELMFDMQYAPNNLAGYSFLYIGCDITATSSLREKDIILEDLSAALKAICDKRRLDILRRLSKGRAYCHELAEIIGTDPGNMSRTLSILHSHGFLRQEREALRNYYETDREAIHNFFQQVEELLFS